MAWVRFVDGWGNYCLARLGFAKIRWLSPGSVPKNEAFWKFASIAFAWGQGQSPVVLFRDLLAFRGWKTRGQSPSQTRDLLAFRGWKTRGQSPSQTCFDLLALWRLLPAGSPEVGPQSRATRPRVQFCFQKLRGGRCGNSSNFRLYHQETIVDLTLILPGFRL
jgi:hypothetical protein